ncbi:hypothetical protein [Streptomyces sp. NPDC001809]
MTAGPGEGNRALAPPGICHGAAGAGLLDVTEQPPPGLPDADAPSPQPVHAPAAG